MIIYNKGRESNYIIFDKKLLKKITENIKPVRKKSFSRILYEKVIGLYFYNSVSIGKDFNKYKKFLSFEKYLKEVLFIEEQEIRHLINNNSKRLRVKRIDIYDSMALFNYLMYFADYSDYGDELTTILEENYELL